MKLIILHGDNVEKSRTRLQRFIDSARRRSWTITRIYTGKDSVQENLVSETLFGNTRLFIIENPKKLTKDEVVWLKKVHHNISETVVIYATSTLNKTLINSLPRADTVELFELPKLIWNFLDSVYPGNARNSLNLLHQTTQNDAVEFVFAMLATHVKDMYHAKVDPSSMKTSPWRVSKLTKQADKFEGEGLAVFINKLAEIDVTTKTSKANLADLLDFLFVTQLE